MSAPQSAKDMVYMCNLLGAQGSTQHPWFDAWFCRSKCLITAFGLANAKIKMCYAFRPLYNN